MRERGMIFNAEMVRAILYGRKTQTRRVMTPQPADDIRLANFPNSEFIGWESSLKHKYGSTTAHICPFGQPGDRIWVRETWARYNIDQESHDMAYRATPPADWPEEGRWRPSIHMPRWASRITLEITGVRVERLNDISEEDARAEGVRAGVCPGHEQIMHQVAFSELWKSIYGDESWQANPWVYVIEFKRVDGNGKGAA